MGETSSQPPSPQRRRRHVLVRIASTICLIAALAVLVDLGADEATRSSLLTIVQSSTTKSSTRIIGGRTGVSATKSSTRIIGGRTGVSANFRLLEGINKIKPGRTLKAALLRSHLRFNPSPNTKGQQCETHWDAEEDSWTAPEEAQPVPAGSRLETNNNFLAKVDFNALNIMVVGDSVGENMALFLENAHAGIGVLKHQRESYREQINLQGRNQDRIWVSHVPEEKGGGYVAFARVLTQWHSDKAGEDDFLKWDPKMFTDFREEHGNVDVLIYRTPWPWMSKFGDTGDITEGEYYRVLEVARRMVNPRTVIFTTSAINNNGISDQFASLRKDNEVVRQFVQHYQPPEHPEDGVQNVLLLDWELLTDDLVLANAEAMGIPAGMAFKHVLTGNGLSDKESFTGVRWFPQLTAMACASITKPTHPKRIPTCMDGKRGRVSPDGMHFCDSTTGPRTAAGIIALIECSVVADEDMYGAFPNERKQYLRECQDDVNNLYMNLRSVFISPDPEDPRFVVPARQLFDPSLAGHLVHP